MEREGGGGGIWHRYGEEKIKMVQQGKNIEVCLTRKKKDTQNE